MRSSAARARPGGRAAALVPGVAGALTVKSVGPTRFVSVVTEKPMTYALGRGLEYYDMPTVRAIVRNAAKHDYGFSSLIYGIATSQIFERIHRPDKICFVPKRFVI